MPYLKTFWKKALDETLEQLVYKSENVLERGMLLWLRLPPMSACPSEESFLETSILYGPIPPLWFCLYPTKKS